MRVPSVRTAFAAVVAALVLFPVSGCSEDPFTPDEVELSCPAAAGGPVTLAVGARANSPTPTLPRQVADLVREAAKSSERIRVLRIDGAPAEAFSGVFRSTAQNDVARANELNTFMTHVLEAVDGLSPKAPEADLLLALNEAARLTDEGGTVVLIDSGLQTAGQIRFQDEGMFGADPDELVTYLGEHDQLPSLEGRSVLLVGLGNTADPQPALTDPGLRKRITQMWETIVDASGAECVQVLETSGPRTSVKTDVPVTVVAFPEPPAFVACGTTVLGDADTVGFVGDKATFRDPGAAKRTLQGLADLVRDGGQLMTLIGTTSSAGTSEAGRVALSRKRAEAVKAVLVDLGIEGARITTEGVGSKGPNRVNDRAPDGSLLPGPAARNRSVVVQLTCPAPG